MFYCPRKDARKMASEKFFCVFHYSASKLFLWIKIFWSEWNQKKSQMSITQKKNTLTCPYAWESFFIWLNRNAETLSNRVYVPNLSQYVMATGDVRKKIKRIFNGHHISFYSASITFTFLVNVSSCSLRKNWTWHKSCLDFDKVHPLTLFPFNSLQEQIKRISANPFFDFLPLYIYLILFLFYFSLSLLALDSTRWSSLWWPHLIK